MGLVDLGVTIHEVPVQPASSSVNRGIPPRGHLLTALSRSRHFGRSESPLPLHFSSPREGHATSPGSVSQAVALAERHLFPLEDVDARAQGGGPGDSIAVFRERSISSASSRLPRLPRWWAAHEAGGVRAPRLSFAASVSRIILSRPDVSPFARAADLLPEN